MAMFSLRFLLILVVVLALRLDIFATAAVVPRTSMSNHTSIYISAIKCKNPLIRKEWRKLGTSKKRAYIDAVKCLQTRPSISDFKLIPGAKTRYDDFHAVHITQSEGLIEGTGGIHLVGHFLPWHRYLIIAYEKALRQECGYKGAQPYWDWTLDSGPGKEVRKSPVFDPITGFGGNGESGVPPPPPTASRPHMQGGTGGGCVVDGPFKNMTLNVGPGQSVSLNPRCLSRSINPGIANEYLTYKTNIAPLWNTTTYKKFSTLTKGVQQVGSPPVITFHGAGHYVTGGEGDDFISSNAEPLFYLHHTFVDALWLKWQEMDHTGKRFWDISGPQVPFTETPEVTLKFPINLGACGVSIPLQKVMDVRKGNNGGVGCYDYQW